MNDPSAVRICATCQKVLDLRVSAFGATYEHTLSDPDDHPVVPVIPPEGWDQGRCDFCNAERPEYALPVRDFTVPGFPTHTSAGGWAACRKCAELIRANNWLALEQQAIRRLRVLGGGIKLSSKEKEPVRKLYRAIRTNVTGPLSPI